MPIAAQNQMREQLDASIIDRSVHADRHWTFLGRLSLAPPR
jgi:hypothetical protein